MFPSELPLVASKVRTVQIYFEASRAISEVLG